ncbi:hypothetical protein VB636_00505, partial [Paracoccus sp. APAP_BH8]|uniref:hypothetical protein n=1 Tax=Paracoccus sp. APAP_BH8 TaxID=3110237 RepID=UPI002FD81694
LGGTTTRGVSAPKGAAVTGSAKSSPSSSSPARSGGSCRAGAARAPVGRAASAALPQAPRGGLPGLRPAPAPLGGEVSRGRCAFLATPRPVSHSQVLRT